MSDVIHAFPGSELPANPVTFADSKPPGAPYYCRHEQIRLDRHLRVVECAVCGAVLDPFDYLVTEACAMREGWRRHKEVRASLLELIERVDALKKEEKRLKAAVKRAADKLPPMTLRAD